MAQITRSDLVAAYFIEDLLQFVDTSDTDLANLLQIPREYSRDPKEIAKLLRKDIVHMLNDGLMEGIHLIISDRTMDKGAKAYTVRYYAHYKIHTDTLDEPPSSQGEREGVEFGAPRKVWRNARIALLIDWSPSALKDKKYRHVVRRPDYYLDWVNSTTPFATKQRLLPFRPGKLFDNGTEIVTREEYTSIEHHKHIT